jgi:nicotinic acid mononucleotide adenylyltransferase
LKHPFPVNYPELLFNYAPPDAKYYMTIYDEWGYEKKELLESIGYEIEVLWEVSLAEKGISGTDVRRRIARGEDWREYVPKYVYDYIIRNHLYEKIQ